MFLSAEIGNLIMTPNFKKIIFIIITLCCFNSAMAAEVKKAKLMIMDAYVPLVAPNSTSASGYFTVQNNNNFQLFLKKIKTDFGNSMLHKTVTNESGIIKMIHLNEIEIGANSSLIFEPGGYHIMFTKINKKLMLGDLIPAKLIFNENIEIDIKFKVEHRKSIKKEHSKHNH